MTDFDVSKFDYTPEEVLETAKQGKLLSAEIEFNRNCNYRCPYCYAVGSAAVLPHDVAVRVIREDRKSVV